MNPNPALYFFDQSSLIFFKRVEREQPTQQQQQQKQEQKINSPPRFIVRKSLELLTASAICSSMVLSKRWGVGPYTIGLWISLP